MVNATFAPQSEVAASTEAQDQTPAKSKYSYQISSSIFGKKFFIAMHLGNENRSDERLDNEQQRRPFWLVALHLGAVAIVAFMFGLLVAYAVLSVILPLTGFVM